MSVLTEKSKKRSRTDSGPFMTTGDVARLCAVDARTIARWVDAGVLPSHRTVGGRRRVLRTDVRQFMRRQGLPQVTAERGARPARIAIVDDDPHMVRALTRLLRRIAPRAVCQSARDGFSAGALLASFQPDLVFLDVVMPGLSGAEVCAHVRSNPVFNRTAIVIVSGALSPGAQARLVAGGADRVLEKPFGPRDIERAVRDYVPAEAAALVGGRSAATRGV